MKLTWTYVLLLAVVAVILGGVVGTGVTLYQNAVTDNACDSVDQTATTKATQLDALLGEQARTVRLQARDPVVLGPDAQRRQALDRFVDVTTFQGVSVIDRNGTMLAIEAHDLSERRRAELIGSDFGHRRYVRAALAGEEYVSEPVEAASGNHIVTMSVPVERDGQTVATLNAALHLQEEATFESIAPTRNGTVVRVTAGETQLYESAEWSTDGMIVAQAPVAATNWTMSVAQPETAVATQARNTILLQASSGLVVLLTLTGFGGWVYRSSIKQIDELGAGFQRLANREYGTEITLTGPREWNAIERQFNAASRALAEYERRQGTRERELEAYTQQLEGTEQRLQEEIEQRKQHEAEIEKQNRQLTVLDRVLRHNLHNDMNVIQGRAEMIQQLAAGDVAWHAGTIISKSNQLLEMVDKEREVTQLLASPTSPTDVDVAAVARAIVSTGEDRFPQADISITGPDALSVRATADVETAIQELLTNAVIHSDRSTPQVDVSLRRNGEQALVRVADDGPGIPAMEQNVLSGENEIEPLYHGTGLGLWLVTEIVSQSDGSLAFEDNEPRGTVVTIRLDRLPDDPAESES